MLQYYYYKRRKRIIKLQGVSNQEVMQPLDRTNASSSRKRKRSTKKKPLKHAKVNSALPLLSSDTDEHNDFCTCSIEQENCMLKNQVDQSTDLEEQESSTLKPTPRRKFSWTENADR